MNQHPITPPPELEDPHGTLHDFLSDNNNDKFEGVLNSFFLIWRNNDRI